MMLNRWMICQTVLAVPIRQHPIQSQIATHLLLIPTPRQILLWTIKKLRMNKTELDEKNIEKNEEQKKPKKRKNAGKKLIRKSAKEK